jgi:integrase
MPPDTLGLLDWDVSGPSLRCTGPTARHPRLLLLLSRDLLSGGHDLPLDDAETASGPVWEQDALPGFEAPDGGRTRRRSRPRAVARPARAADDPLLAVYARRLEALGAARKGRQAYHYHLRSTLTVASRLADKAVTSAGLFQDERLLGRALVDDTAPTLGHQLSKWTLAPRRSALRSFAKLMRPELLPLLGEDPHERLDRALRAVAERVGGGYRLTGGAPRRRGGSAPSAREIRAVLDAVGGARGYHGARNAAFFTILAETGARVNALRTLDAADCFQMPSGRLRIFLYDKGKAEPREVELSHMASEALRAYAAAFNRVAGLCRWRVRVHLGESGAVWRNSPRGCWSDHDVRATLRAACATAHVCEVTPHAFRRAFATDTASVLPRHIVAQAGGWKGLERLDDHYVQARPQTIWAKLRRAEQHASHPDMSEEGLRDAALVAQT